MFSLKNCLTLYAVTGSAQLTNCTIYEAVEQALKGGVTMLQLREKSISAEELVKEAVLVKEITKKYGVPLIINDNVQAAMAVNADGVHLGQGDMPVNEARKLLGKSAIIGKTVKTLGQALQAKSDGADYLGAGAAFETATKKDTWVIDHSVYNEIVQSANIPIVAIGGITEDNAAQLSGTGIDGIAVVGAIFAQKNIFEAAVRMRAAAEKIKQTGC